MGVPLSSDFSAEASSAKLRQLSDEVNRIATKLARLAIVPETEDQAATPDRRMPGVSVEAVRQAIQDRRLRARYFNEELFADPAWDMLLHLFQHELEQFRVPVSALCDAAAVPPTTALRWINTMTNAGMFRRRPDPNDGRRVFMELTPEASQAMRRYFRAAGRPLSV